MQIYRTDPELLPPSAQPVPGLNLADDPVIALLYDISGVLMELLGPMFWAALIVLFIQAELFTR